MSASAGRVADTFVQANQNAGAPTTEGANESEADSGVLGTILNTGFSIYRTVSGQSDQANSGTQGPVPSQQPGATIRTAGGPSILPWIIGGVVLLLAFGFLSRR